MAKRPDNVSWVGFTTEQAKLLEFLDFLGNNGWDRNGQTDEALPNLLKKFEDLGVPMARVKEAMRSIGYDDYNLRQLDRWERKRTTGRFDPPRSSLSAGSHSSTTTQASGVLDG